MQTNLDEELDNNYPQDCTCDRCQRACRRRVGWFLPGEPEKAASFLGMELQEFFNKYLAVDWFEGDDENIFVIAPSTTEISPGGMFSEEPEGKCVFFSDEGRCNIHEAKPYECKRAACDNQTNIEPNRVIISRHELIARKWIPHRNQIDQLLSKEAKNG